MGRACYLSGRETQWSNFNGALSSCRWGDLVKHDVNQHLQPKEHETTCSPLHPGEATARRAPYDGEPQVAIVEVLAGMVTEKVGEILHLLASGHWNQSVDLYVTGGKRSMFTRLSSLVPGICRDTSETIITQQLYHKKNYC